MSEILVRSNPWSILGESISTSKSLDEAMVNAGLDWEVITKGVYYNDEITGTVKRVPDRLAVVRKDTGEFISEVSANSKQISNSRAFSFMNSLIDSSDLELVKAGSIAGGKKVWAVGKLSERLILDDKIDPYIIMTNSHEGSRKPLEIFLSPTRIACSNQLNSVSNVSKSIWRSDYLYEDPNQQVEQVRNILRITDKKFQALDKEANEFAMIKMSKSDFYEIATTLYPVSDDAPITKKARTKNEYYLESLTEAYNKDDLNNFRDSSWGVLNAFSDFLLHTKPYDDKKSAEELALDNFNYIQGAMATLLTVRYMIMNKYGVKFNHR